MNADHELDEAEVTEMTQMISALEQNGFTHDLATKYIKKLVNYVMMLLQKFMKFLKQEINKPYMKFMVKL